MVSLKLRPRVRMFFFLALPGRSFFLCRSQICAVVPLVRRRCLESMVVLPAPLAKRQVLCVMMQTNFYQKRYLRISCAVGCDCYPPLLQSARLVLFLRRSEPNGTQSQWTHIPRYLRYLRAATTSYRAILSQPAQRSSNRVRYPCLVRCCAQT